MPPVVTSEADVEVSTDAVDSAVPGLPIIRTLEAVAVMAARLGPSVRCAILMLEDDQLIVAAGHNILSEDERVLRSLRSLATAIAFAEAGREHNAIIKPLLTEAAELIGALVVFGIDQVRVSQIQSRLDEVGWIATLAIEQKHLSEELSYRAHHDPLTHLWNRIWMEEELERVLEISAGTGRPVGLLMVGIDRFRVINDVLGHHIGNQLLRQIGARLADYLGPNFPLARSGGDEFMVLMPSVTSPHSVATVSERLLRCFDGVFRVGEHELVIKASIGSTVSKPGNCTSEELQSQVYSALQYAKRRVRGQVVSFECSMASIPPERLVMEQHLRFALQKREFEVYYQPQVELASGNLIGVEALLRWKHPSLGFISPGVFIPLAEEIGIIEEIGNWVLDEAISQLERWRAAELRDLRMAVNVSALQFSRADFGDSVAQKLKHSRILPSELELEMTETLVMTNFDHGLRQLKALRSLGVMLAIDDFGTGHSSLAYLQQLPVHRLKVDRMFVREITSREDRPPLLASIIQMAHALNLSVIAEGVESTEQVLALSAMGCEEVQGFLFSKPLPASDLLSWEKGRRAPQSNSSPGNWVN